MQRTVSRDVCARPFTLQGDSFSSCAPCVPCQKQRVSPGLLRPAPRLACARPRSGRTPLPSDKQRAFSRNLCTRDNPCLLARDLAAGTRPCRATSSERSLGTSAPGTTHACLRATSQRALAPAERLHPGQPMLACAQPRSGRPPLPSVKQRAPSRNLLTPKMQYNLTHTNPSLRKDLASGGHSPEIHNCMTDLSINPYSHK